MVIRNNPLVKKYALILAVPVVIIFIIALVVAFNQQKPSSLQQKTLVSFDDYRSLVAEVEPHRAARLVNFNKFLEMSKEEGTIILDTRSDEMYAKKHLKGAVHLDFSNFTQENLAKVIPSNTTRILIYCNNNFSDDQKYFTSKMMIQTDPSKKSITLALNIPTYINLYGYGYKNVYELSDLLSTDPKLDPRVKFEGTEVSN